jgi:hypothetical protein
MKKSLILILLLSLAAFAFADYVPYKHGVDINLGGPASAFSLEYQYNLIVMGLNTVGVSGAIGKLENGYTFPLGMQYRFGKIHQLELGAHLTPIFIKDPNLQFQIALSGKLGYRININRFYMHINLLPSFPREHTTVSLGCGFYFGHAVLDRKIEYYTPTH